LVVPVPGGASGVSGLGIVEGTENAGPVLEVVSLETSQTQASGVVGFALITDGNADLVGIESPSV
jgi:hypothetical protein